MRSPFVTLFLCICCTLTSQLLAQNDPKFEVWTKDGMRTVGKTLNPFYQNLEEKLVLDGKSFDDAANPVRSVLAIEATGTTPSGPWVEFVNGDRLPARIVRWLPAQQSLEDGARGEQVMLGLELGNGANDLTSNIIAVRADSIARCYDSAANAVQYPPGTVITRDGRRVDARGIRFREPGLDCLTESGIVQVAYDQLATVVWPRQTGAFGAESDALWSTTEKAALPPVARIRTTRGMTLTAGNQVLRRGRETDKNLEYLALRPNWSWQTLRIPPERVRWISWRGERELPLNALPHEFVVTGVGAKRWPPRVDQNVQGDELRSGDLRTDSGWGVHSGTSIMCQLPSESERVSGWVGVDRCVGRGGCAQARIVRDREDGETLWRSEFLLGDKPPQRFDVETRGAKALLLIVDEAHDGRPAGADPWDIRDHIDWLRPLVTLKSNDQTARRSSAAENPVAWMPGLAGFQLAEADRGGVELRPYWAKTRGFSFVINPTNDDTMNNDGITFERTVPISWKNAWLQVSVGHDVSRRHHHVIIAADGTEIVSSNGSRLYDGARTIGRGGFDNRSYSLFKFLDQSPKLTIRLPPDQKKSSQSGIEFDTIAFNPLVIDLPADGKFLRADVPLPVPSKREPAPKPEWKWEPGKTYEGKPLTLRGAPFDAGIGAPQGTAMTFNLDPSYKRFVAVLGVADGWGDVVGPVEILLDDEPFWKSPGKYDSRAPLQQIDLALPEDHKTLTIKSPAANGILGLGNAGFMK